MISQTVSHTGHVVAVIVRLLWLSSLSFRWWTMIVVVVVVVNSNKFWSTTLFTKTARVSCGCRFSPGKVLRQHWLVRKDSCIARSFLQVHGNVNISEIYVSMYLIYVNRQSHLGLSNSIASGGTSFESTNAPFRGTVNYYSLVGFWCFGWTRIAGCHERKSMIWFRNSCNTHCDSPTIEFLRSRSLRTNQTPIKELTISI